MTQHLLAQAILDRLLQTRQRNLVKLDKKRKVSHLVVCVFISYCQILNSGRMTDNSVIYPPQIEIFLNIFQFFKVLTYNLLVNLLGYWYIKFFYCRYNVSFYLWWIGSLLKRCKVPKYDNHNCLKLFFYLSAPIMLIEISEKYAGWTQKVKLNTL